VKRFLESEFENDLKTMGLVFTKPDGYECIPPRKNFDVRYVYALRNAAKDFELRYMLRPIFEQVREFSAWITGQDRGTKILTNPNTTYSAFISTVVINVTGNGAVESVQRLDSQDAKNRLGADDVSMTIVTPESTFGEDFASCIILAMFKENIGTAFMFHLSRDTSPTASDFDAIMQSLKFSSAPYTGSISRE
jgi:hypothetical protein